MVTDKAATSPIVLEERLPAVWHHTEPYANNHVEADHGRLKARVRPMRGLRQDRSARIIIAGHAFVQNLRRGHYELAVQASMTRRVVVAFGELASAIGLRWWLRLQPAAGWRHATPPCSDAKV